MLGKQGFKIRTSVLSSCDATGYTWLGNTSNCSRRVGPGSARMAAAPPLKRKVPCSKPTLHEGGLCLLQPNPGRNGQPTQPLKAAAHSSLLLIAARGNAKAKAKDLVDMICSQGSTRQSSNAELSTMASMATSPFGTPTAGAADSFNTQPEIAKLCAQTGPHSVLFRPHCLYRPALDGFGSEGFPLARQALRELVHRCGVFQLGLDGLHAPGDSTLGVGQQL